ncbi:MAG: hypothetical protein KDB14_14520 [Planctomycetales bacterium]|nr:hypothetical protein [Planctomycetales bacterium]
MTNSKLSPAIRSTLSELRWRIRAYVVADGLALAAVWLGLTFWLGLALDYLPVLTWASEIPRAVRGVVLVVVAGGLAWILYYYLLRRVLVRLHDRSMALLVERRFKGFSDELVTAVELEDASERDELYDPEMLERTRRMAEQRVSRLRLADIFDSKPLTRHAVLAVVLLAPIVPFALLQPETMKIWAQRFYMLKDVPWPRDTMVQVLGFQPQRKVTPGAAQDGPLPVRSFGAEQHIKIARGGGGTLRVRAKSRSGKAAPEYCTVYYRAADGVRSSVRMNKFGRLGKDGYQEYTLAAKPFKGILEDLRFDIVAHDRRLSGYELQVVDSPKIETPELHCVFPPYLVDESTSSWQPRDMPYIASGTSLPVGTSVTMKLTVSKDVREAVVRMGEDGEPVSMPVTEKRQLEIGIPALEGAATMFVSVIDTDGVEMERPQKFVINAIKDNPPKLEVLHRGISSMVTPDVLIPVEGKAEDDYLIDRAWFEVATPDGQLREYADVTVDKDGKVAGALDVRSKRGLTDDAKKLELTPGMRIMVTAMAADRYDLSEQKNVGSGVRLDLEVVTPERLLTSLDQRELAQRKVFEHVIEEMNATRDDLARVERELTDGDAPSEDLDPADPAEKDDPEKLKQRAAALRLLRIQQASLQAEKSGQETAAVGATFEDIVLELKNNRIDSEDRSERLTNKVAAPIARLAEELFPKFEERLDELEKALESNGEGRTDLAVQTVEQADELLAEMNKILQDMLYIESYNELVEALRAMAEEQASLRQETEREKAKSLKGLLE